MNERIQELLIEAHKQTSGGIYNGHLSEWTEKFAELIVGECMDNLAWHGHDEAVSQLEWLRVNRFGIKQ